MHGIALFIVIPIAMEARLEAQLTDYAPRDIVKTQIEFANVYACNLQREKAFTRKGTNLHDWIEDQQDYLEWSINYWFPLWMAQNTRLPLSERMDALSELKEILFRTNGIMPPLVCFWQFREGPPPPEHKPSVPKGG
jgi:hypothetical protein